MAKYAIQRILVSFSIPSLTWNDKQSVNGNGVKPSAYGVDIPWYTTIGSDGEVIRIFLRYITAE